MSDLCGACWLPVAECECPGDVIRYANSVLATENERLRREVEWMSREIVTLAAMIKAASSERDTVRAALLTARKA